MREIVIGIDPGEKGFACVWHERLKMFSWYPLSDMEALRAMLDSMRGSDAVVCMEHVGAIKGSSSSTTFKFGRNVGTIAGMVMAYGLPLCEVTPQRWQREMWEPQDRVSVEGKVHTKMTSIRAARRLHPGIDFRRSDKCAKPDDNKVDATLICDYARRMNL